MGDQDVYNITAPFELAGKEVIAGRIESRDSEVSTVSLFEEVESNRWTLIADSIELSLQDPFILELTDKSSLGVEVVF